MKKILVVATRQIGDVLLTTPLIHAARQQWPDAEIDVIGLAGTLGMLQGNPDIHALITTQPSKGWRDTLAVLKTIWKRYDLALVTQPSDRAHLIGWAASRQHRSGIIPAHNSSNWWKKRILGHVVVSEGDAGTVHVVAEKLALLAPWCRPDLQAAQVLPPPAQALPPALDAVILPSAIVVHAPSMWPYKQWPVAHFRELLERLVAEGHQIVLTGSAGPADQACIEQLRGIAPSPQLVDTSGQLNFNQLVSLFRRASLYIGPDTSVTHLAAASGIRVLALFGPTNPVRWGPWPSAPRITQSYVGRAERQTVHSITLLQSTLPCVPCSKAGCEDHTLSRSDCLLGMPAERVLRAVRTASLETRS
ncbi:glycosyltransferase family 9 protein [Rhodoferax sp. WC2427]|uniref:glycosyltransferase family 9 protein n=1 Tax=Rhodoferax sp. WC2427 TaxID=3234144 RepID=UPI0034676FEE